MKDCEKNTELREKLLFKTKGVYDADSAPVDEIYGYAGKYMRFLDAAKTEREAVEVCIAEAEAAGYVGYKLGDRIEVGGKYYLNNRGKSVILMKVGTESPEKGVYICAAHIDSPRIDLKQNPLYEDAKMGYFKTHYYGGIKKYQWTATPLSLHGTVIKADGSRVKVCVGEDEGDPVFYITDLLIHLSREQMSKTLAEGITGESLNLLIGSRPVCGDNGEDAVKLNVMRLLNEKYGITEADFLSAELTAVPALKARDVGFDRSLIAGYGHDDRVCAYPAYTALLDSVNEEKTAIVVLSDKEEIGSEGVTGMQSAIFCDLLAELAAYTGTNERVIRSNSKCLSADVNAAFDPNYAEAYERRNSAYVNGGVVLTKYTGSRGKSDTSDAAAEYVGYVRSVFDVAGVVWQTSELGKVDQGGGGTVAKYIANFNIDTVDIGVPVLSMHAPCEVIAKADLYMAYRAFSAFIG